MYDVGVLMEDSPVEVVGCVSVVGRWPVTTKSLRLSGHGHDIMVDGVDRRQPVFHSPTLQAQ